MSSTPIYDELAATYLADLTAEPGDPAGPDQAGQHAVPAADRTRPTADRTRPQTEPRGRPKV